MLTHEEWNALLDHALESSPQYIVRISGSAFQSINGHTGMIKLTNASATTVIQDAMNAMSNGTLYIKPGAYGSVALSVNNGTIVVIDIGAATITCSPAAGATCIIFDYNAGIITYYEEGLLTSKLNMNLGDLYLYNSLTTKYITGSILVSGADFRGPTATITSINANYITGSILISGANFMGSTATITNINANYITGSILISGADFRGPTATITNINADYITGSILISGADFRGPTATFANINTNYITGSILVSGADFRGPKATITNINATNITGSIISGADFRGPIATITSVNANYITGSILISGADFRGVSATITNVNANYITGSTLISGANFVGPSATITNISGSQESLSGNLYVKGEISGSIEKTASYIIRKSGSNYEAINGSKNAVDYSGTNANTVIQAAIDAMTSGKIFLKDGIYTIPKDEFLALAANQDITIEGENALTTIIAKENGGVYANDYVIRGTLTNTNAPNLTLRNLYFDCSVYTGAAAVGGQYFTRFIAENVNGVGSLQADGTNDQAVFFGCCKGKEVRIERCDIRNTGYSTWIYCWTDVKILDNYVENSGTVGLGVGKVPTENARVLIRGNTLVDCGWRDEGLVIDAGWDEPVTKIEGIISDNIIYNPTKACRNGNIAVVAVSGVVVQNNHIVETITPYDTDSDCIHIAGSYTNPMSNIVVRNNHIESSDVGMTFKNTFDFRAHGNTILLRSGASIKGIYMTGDTNVTVTGANYICDNNIIFESGGVDLQRGVNTYIFSGGGGTTTVNIFRNNIEFKTGFTKLGIALQSNHDGVTTNVSDNYIVNATVDLYIHSTNAGPAGYLKDSGTACLSAPSGSVVHELVSSPRIVNITSSGSFSTYGGGFYWYPSGSNGIWIQQTGSGLAGFNWQAEV